MRLFTPAFAVPLLALAASAAHAQAPQPAALFDENTLRAYVSQQLAGSATQLTRFEVQVGNIDARLGLAPCRRTEPFLAASARLWGRSSVGLRCADGANWSILVPVTVRAWGLALVAAAPLAAGAELSAQDVGEREVELTREPANLLRDRGQLPGRTLNRPLLPGQVLNTGMFRQALAVQAGDPVRLRIRGQGFAVTAVGQALANAAEGQGLRVRTDLGKTLTGVARAGRMVDVDL